MCFAHVRSAAVSLHVDNEHSALFIDNAQRYFKLKAVKSFNIQGMLFEETNRRRLFRMLNKDTKVEELHNKKVKMWKRLGYCSPTRVLCLVEPSRLC